MRITLGPYCDKVHMKLYTVREFAREMGISRSTVTKLIKEERIEGLIRDGRSYLIPESNLSIPVQKKRKSIRRVIILTEAQAREAYSLASGNRKNKLKFTYDELKEMFDGGRTIESIALSAGVTKQRIGQVYNRFFSFGVDGYKRRSIINQIATKERELQTLMDNERISYLNKITIEKGLSIIPIQIGKGPHLHRGAVDINGHLCKIHFSRKDTKFAGTSYRSYSRILVTKHFLDSYEFIIALTGADEDTKRIFIIPSNDLKTLFRRGDKRKSIYLPTSEEGAYRNISATLNWRKYQEAWHLLGNSG